jgi:hypothetical protein
MSTTRPNGVRIVLPRFGADEFWQLIHDHFAGEDARSWKYLAMLALRENAGWPLERIGQVFGHPKGHVTRCLAKIKEQLRDRFQAAPEYLDLPDDELDARNPDVSAPRRRDPDWPIDESLAD